MSDTAAKPSKEEQQARFLRGDKSFREFSAHSGYGDPEQFIKDFCKIKSLQEISTSPEARDKWKELCDKFFVWEHRDIKDIDSLGRLR